MRQLVRQVRRLTREANDLEREIAKLVVGTRRSVRASASAATHVR
jgi:hypothetical protein